jgi:hypothetical protein
VYNHFPTDVELLDACSSHWFAANPPPDPTPWAEIAEPGLRVVTALSAMYDYYDQGREMLENVLRDAPLVPALADILQQKWEPLMEGIVGILAGTDKASNVALRASARVALDFFTWRMLAAAGLSNHDAARLAASWVDASRRHSSPPGSPE